MNNKIEKNEINQILNTIFKYKSLIFGITILFIILAFLYASFIQKPIYQADILLKIATTNTLLVEDENKLVQILSSRYDIDNYINNQEGYISSIIKPKYSKGVIRLFARGYYINSIKNILTQKAQKIREEHNKTVELYIKDQNQIIDNVKKDIDNMKENQKRLISQNIIFQNKLNNISKDELSLVGVYAVSMLRNDNTIIELMQQITKQHNFLIALNTTLQSHRTFNSRVSGGVHINSKTMTPSRKLIIILGFTTGLLFSILLALFLQFLRDRRE